MQLVIDSMKSQTNLKRFLKYFLIGGQAFTIKLRKTKERSSSSLLLEPPYQVNSSFPEYTGPPKWRQMK
jgi:hypothetical protein